MIIDSTSRSFLWRDECYRTGTTTKEVSRVNPIAGFARWSHRVRLGFRCILGKGHLRRIELQRLFSTFPGGWPGVGLLLLRALVGFMLIARGLAYLNDWSNPAPVTLAAGALAVASGFCLLSGFLTPIAGVLVAIGSLGFAFSSFAEPAFDLFHSKLVIVNVIVISMAIALLGPGAFSLDALMFGRREISIPQSLHSPRPK